MGKKKKSPGLSKGITAVSVLVSLIVVYLLMAPLIGKSLVQDGDDLNGHSLQRAASVDCGNYVYPYFLGMYRLNRKTARDIKTAIPYFDKSLGLNPLHLYSWFGLAATYYLSGDKEKANLLFDKLNEMNTINSDLAWDSGMFLLTQDERKRGMTSLRRFLLLDPGYSDRVFGLCYQFQLSTEEMAATLLKDNRGLYELFLRYLVMMHRTEDIIAAWQMIAHRGIDGSTKLSVCNELVDKERYDLAGTIWKELRDDRKNTGFVQNSGFEEDILNGCFDWREGSGDGVSIGTDSSTKVSGNRSMRIIFDGEHNPGIVLLSQIVPIQSGEKYRFSASVRSDEVTTTNGVFFAINGYHCDALGVRSDMVTGTRPWTEISMKLTMPETCEAVVISAIRERSSKLNNKIKGQVWVDDIQLTKEED